MRGESAGAGVWPIDAGRATGGTAADKAAAADDTFAAAAAKPEGAVLRSAFAAGGKLFTKEEGAGRPLKLEKSTEAVCAALSGSVPDVEANDTAAAEEDEAGSVGASAEGRDGASEAFIELA